MFNKLKIMNTLVSLSFCLALLTGCGKQSKKGDTLSFDGLKNKAITAMNNKNDYDAIVVLEKLVTQHADDQNIPSHKLSLADLYFKHGRHGEAYEMYTNFHEMYPSEKNAEYAAYHALLCKYYQTLDPACDATETEETIKLCKNYYQMPGYARFTKDVKDIEKTCIQKLIDKEVYVFNFYLHQDKVAAAENRLKHLKEHFLPKYPAIAPHLLFLEGKLAKNKNQVDVVDQKVAQLITRYPDSPYTKMARSLVEQNVFVF